MSELPLAIMVCPESHQSLRYASTEEMETLTQRFEAGTLENRSGTVVSETFSGALLREDGQIAYLIRNQIPILLAGEAIVM